MKIDRRGLEETPEMVVRLRRDIPDIPETLKLFHMPSWMDSFHSGRKESCQLSVRLLANKEGKGLLTMLTGSDIL